MRFSRLLFTAALALGATAFARADDTAEFLKPSNWEGRTDLWKVENGSIVGETKQDPKYNTFLCSKQPYGDFELSFKVQLRGGTGNSGVQIRSQRVDAAGSKQPFVVGGPQADIGANYWGSLYGEKFGADGAIPGKGHMMKASPVAKVKEKVKPGEWNDFTIRAVGTRVTITVNGETMTDGEYAKLPKEGIVAFQIHGGFPTMRVEFKDVTFTKLGAK